MNILRYDRCEATISIWIFEAFEPRQIRPSALIFLIQSLGEFYFISVKGF